MQNRWGKKFCLSFLTILEDKIKKTMLCAATEMNFTLLLNKVAFLYLLKMFSVCLFNMPVKAACWKANAVKAFYYPLQAVSLSWNWVYRKKFVCSYSFPIFIRDAHPSWQDDLTLHTNLERTDAPFYWNINSKRIHILNLAPIFSYTSLNINFPSF